MSTLVIAIAAFHIGQATAKPEPAPAADPCAGIITDYSDLEDSLRTAPESIRPRAIAHYVVDHPGCFPPDLVATFKAMLDQFPPAG